MMLGPTLLMLQASVPGALPVASSATLPVGVCLTRPYADSKGNTSDFPVVVQASEVAKLVSNGFGVAVCNGLHIDAEEYRSNVCDLDKSSNSAVQARLESVLGVKPKLLCDDAKLFGAALSTILAQNG